MKKYTLTKWIVTTAAVLGLGISAQAIPITGSINFSGGTATLNGPINSATAITAFGGSPIVNPNFGVAPTDSFAGTEGVAVTFLATGFQFSPVLSPNPVTPLWTFDFSGKTYSFDLTSVTSSIGVGPALNLAGLGVLKITGFEDTVGTWSFTTTGTGPTTFGFVAGNTSVPDGGTTVMLLGATLSGLGLLRRKFLA